MIVDKLKEIKQIQINVKLNNTEYTARKENHSNFIKYLLPIGFLRDILVEDADDKQSQLVSKFRDVGNISVEEMSFL